MLLWSALYCRRCLRLVIIKTSEHFPTLQFCVSNSLPLTLQVAAEVSAPLARVDEIVMVGDDRMTSEVSKLVSQLPPAVQALTGVDLSKVRLSTALTFPTVNRVI